jgi:tetratricopeptide (TPR) repeat protein
MRKTVNTQQLLKKQQEKKIFYIKVEKLIREASDTFIYFKDYASALNLIEEALLIEPLNSKAFILKGHLLLCTDNEERAIKYFKKAISVDLFSAEAHGAMAGTLYMLGRHQEAFEYNEKAFEYLMPKDKNMLPSLYDQKISMLIQMKKYEEAQFMLQKSTKYLSNEDSCNLLSSYQETIKNHCKLRKLKKQKLAQISLKLV